MIWTKRRGKAVVAVAAVIVATIICFSKGLLPTDQNAEQPEEDDGRRFGGWSIFVYALFLKNRVNNGQG